ncbi:MAG: hypothetical protein LBQ20_05640 [Rhodanobacter sp.]|jgi:ketopantoate reductase|nr:hypothetical protein [Rhodanobacter sp.]
MKNSALLLLLAVSAICTAAELKTGGVVLLQPDQSLQQKGFVVSDLANYIRQVQAASISAVQPSQLPPSSGFVVVAVRAGGKSNAWLDISPSLPPELEQAFIQGLRQIPPFHVSNGTVLFGIQVMVNGAAPPTKKIPNPAAWQKAAATLKNPIEVENLVQVLWP